MKKIFKSRIFAFILGAILFTGIGAYAASISAQRVAYEPEDNTWRVDNVNSALNELYNSMITYNNPDKIITAQDNITVDDDYNYCILAIARGNTNGTTLKLNGESITPLSYNVQYNASVTNAVHIFNNIYKDDYIEYIGVGTLLCWY